MFERRALLLPLAAFVLLLLCGWVGGPQNPVDFWTVEEAARLRSHDPMLMSAPALLTQVGNAYVLLPLSAMIVLALVALGRRHSALLLFVTVAGERLILDGLKIIVERPRPEFDNDMIHTHSFSFPSGHAANTMTVFVAIALFALPARYRTWSVPLAIFVAALIGATRPWLGVHWPTDIVGGWMLAYLAIAAALLVERHFRLGDSRARTKA